VTWWRNAVVYQVYVRSFADSNGDGVGDLPGLVSRLDHLAWLGVDALWCTPITVSPDRDFGYDVSDYLAVQPAFGTLDDLRTLVAEAGRRGIRVLLDLVPNHTSDRHPWFRDPGRRGWYVWSDRPNNWVSSFGGSAWEYHPEVGRWYLHNFFKEQPDLDWWNEEVRAEFDRILRFWLDLGVAGFRVDVADGMIKDRWLRDNPPASAEDEWTPRSRGQRFVFNRYRPETHEILRRWRRIADAYRPPRVLLGEVMVREPEAWAAYYGRGDELHLVTNFRFQFAPFEPASLSEVVEASLAALGDAPWAVPLWHGSNHDFSRFPTRWCRGDERLVRLALTMLLTLPGSCILYQGDEIGLEDVPVPSERRRDPVGRDPARTPMPWSGAAGAGFTQGEPWLPLGDHRARNVADQRRDPNSVLRLTRDLIRLRKRLRGPYRREPGGSGCWRYRRGGTLVELDFETPAARILEA
jgi:alpha-glucosidase